MEENKYICPECGTEMIAEYEKPALNLTCPKCGCKIATSKWDDIDLDDNDYQIDLIPIINPTMDQIKLIAQLTGFNFINAKKLLVTGGVLIEAKALEIKEKRDLLSKNQIGYIISPEFPY